MFLIVLLIGIALWIYGCRREEKIRCNNIIYSNMESDARLYRRLKELGLSEEEMNKKGYLYDFKIKKLRDAGMIKQDASH